MTITYDDYKTARQKEFNELPIFFAFSNKQFEKAMNERGLTIHDTDKIYKISGGGFYLKKDAPIIRAWLHKEDPLDELMKDADFAEGAFYSEMANHEYHINYQGDYDVCSCFKECEFVNGYGYAEYLTEAGYGKDTIDAFKRAKERFLKDADANNWY